VEKVEMISPDLELPPKFEWQNESGGILIEILSLDLYAVVVVETCI